MQQTQDGRGVSKTTTAEEQNQLRRANKAKQKRGRSARQHPNDSFLAGLQEDRRIQREADKAESEFRCFEFRRNQANKARECEEFTSLKRGSLAYRVAELMLDSFPLAEPYEEEGRTVSRTESAYREALSRLNGDEVLHTAAIYCGKARARKALLWAYDALQSID